MTVITTENFNEKFPEIKKSIEEAKLISIDLEFSALHPFKTPSLFDSPRERYHKLRYNTSHIIPVQVGITTFTFDPKDNSYHGKIYNFYTSPACFPTLQRSFSFQNDTIAFLKLYEFDFNQLFYLGIPYINRQQENQLRQHLSNNEITENQSWCRLELEEECNKWSEVVSAWQKTAKEGDCLSLDINTKHKYNYELLYFMHKHFRTHFKVWTTLDNDKFVLKHVPTTASGYKTVSLDEELINNLLGFTKVFRLITSTNKPVIGHNLLQDILLLTSSFETPLPVTYSGFKRLTKSLFPLVFDTKTISYELKHLIPEDKLWGDTGLGTLFEYFKDGTGRHLVLNSPAVLLERDHHGKFHEAGWDSFCTGYIFIRMAYLNVYHKFPKSKVFMSSELIGGLSQLKNRVNVIRGAVSSIQFDGDDPTSTRPPYLVIESVKNQPIDISQVTSLLSSFGFVEVRKFPHQTKRVLIAVDNFTSAKRIFGHFKNHNEFQVRQYSVIKHSPVVRAFLLSGITISGAALLWLTHRCYNK